MARWRYRSGRRPCVAAKHASSPRRSSRLPGSRSRSPYRSPGTPIASLNNKLEAASADNMLSFVLRLDNVEWSRGAFMIIDRRTTNPIARLRPIPDTDRFELFYWSNAKGRWTTFGNLGRMKLMLERAHKIVESDPMFRIPHGR